VKRVLICEDEETIRDFVVIHLKRAGYEVTAVRNGDEALKAFTVAEKDKAPFDIALLDIMMPGPPEKQGDKICKALREKNKNLGIIMLSAKAQEMDKIGCLMNGADDYVTKPFSPSELIARVDAIYRRVELSSGATNTNVGANYTVDNSGNQVLHNRRKEDNNSVHTKPQKVLSGPFTLDSKGRSITKNDKPLELTQVEFQILEFFINREGTAIERKEILTQIWGESYYGDDKIIDVNIRRLRMKIENDPSKPEFLQTVWGFGYKWNVGEV